VTVDARYAVPNERFHRGGRLVWKFPLDSPAQPRIEIDSDRVRFDYPQVKHLVTASSYLGQHLAPGIRQAPIDR
jgi:hypothetical protein